MSGLAYKLPANTTEAPEGIHSSNPPSRMGRGMDYRKRTGYGGPCPPIGGHRYFHTFDSLNTQLQALNKPTRADVGSAMRGHGMQRSTRGGAHEKSC